MQVIEPFLDDRERGEAEFEIIQNRFNNQVTEHLGAQNNFNEKILYFSISFSRLKIHVYLKPPGLTARKSYILPIETFTMQI